MLMKVFISHSSTDKKFVRTLKDCLNANGIETFFDEDQLDLGDNLVSKLESALNETSHLVIILSPSSINSKWVKFELKKAIDNHKTGVTQKIIPIKYRECEIPSEINDLLHHDLTSEVVIPIDETEKVKFISKGFEPFLLKLVRAIKSTSNSFNDIEKQEIIKAIKSAEKEIEKDKDSVHRGHYEITGYSNVASKTKYSEKVLSGNEALQLKETRPILLPLSLKGKFKIELGERIELVSDNMYKSYGHFAGYRIDDLKLVLDINSRDELRLLPNQLAQVEYYLDKKLIHIFSNMKNYPGNYPGFFIATN